MLLRHLRGVRVLLLVVVARIVMAQVEIESKVETASS
jgi:hypothetical protein